MVANFKVFKKNSPNEKLTLYLPKRDFVDHISCVDPIECVVLIDPEYLVHNKKIFGQVVVCFRYGREEDEVMGLTFQKELYLASEQIYPPTKKDLKMSKLQERLVKKLGSTAYPVTFEISTAAPTSVVIQGDAGNDMKACGVEYFVKLYHHGDRVSVNICVRNHSNKEVKKIKASVQQCIDITMFTSGQYRVSVASIETEEGCPISPGSSLQKVLHLSPSLEMNKRKPGVALDGKLRHHETSLASSTLLADPDQKDIFGIIVSYVVRVKLYLGALGGELTAELPVVIMNPKPDKLRIFRADSTADVETFRQQSVENDLDDDVGMIGKNIEKLRMISE
ncbi:unnamed protein product [Notodromas monacha]|uniref:Arrestin C-terminal-like domain-containing protein n=1 Tax=Notodromas monacha TaxID=399045 RepID=A0A7R9BI30_9CRUS|nr:unnamed protein product [Notodromas monacha]CAG0914523.1 unnamed protein product [Notodromas monacha]